MIARTCIRVAAQEDPDRIFKHEPSILYCQRRVELRPISPRTHNLIAPIPLWSRFPFRSDPSPSLEPVQRRIERAVLHLEKIIRGPLNMFADLVTVSRTIKKSSQDQHVKSALKKVSLEMGKTGILSFDTLG